MKEPKELSPIEAAKEIEYELLTQKLRNIVQELGELNKKYPFSNFKEKNGNPSLNYLVYISALKNSQDERFLKIDRYIDGTNYPHVGESVNEGYLLRSMAIIHSFALEIKSSIANEIDDLFTQLGSEIVEYFSEK
jgi:hypothetical protein